MPSYESINYTLRPAKHIERKMMLDVFRSLGTFDSVAAYRYIGFGSIYFSDFYLVHKHLGITDMISIEKDSNNEKRFSFNRPFSCISIQFGNSVDVLPTLAWDRRTIIWLDYDGTLDKDVLADIRCVCSNLAMGSMLIITVNAEPESKDNQTRAVELLKKRIGENNVPSDITDSELRKWGTAQTYRRIIHNQIQESVSDRNGVLNPGNKVIYQQLFNFNYADGMKMVTVGGVFYDEGQISLMSVESLVSAFPFIRRDEFAYQIRVPNLTYREIRHLDRLLPSEGSQVEVEIGIPEDDLRHYSETYRYFPNFVDIDI